jgi:hypothetical protein
MFYLGEYDEEAAKELRRFLDEVGIRMELKPSIGVDTGKSYSLEGRLSQLKEVIKDLSKYEHRLSVIKSTFPQCKTEEEFDDLFMKEFDPSWAEKREKLIAIKKNPDSLSKEVQEFIEENSTKWMATFGQVMTALSFAKIVIEMNGVEIGEPLEDKLDDPLLDIPIDPDDYDPEPENLKRNFRFNFFRSIGVYIDEHTAPLAIDLDEDFQEMYSNEYQQLRVLGLLMEKLTRSPHSQKMDVEEFANLCFFQLKEKKGFLWIDGSGVAEELAKVLEKNGALKIKGNNIKWRI